MNRFASVFATEETLVTTKGRITEAKQGNSIYLDGEPILEPILYDRWWINLTREYEAVSILSATFRRFQSLQDRTRKKSDESALSSSYSIYSLFSRALPFRKFWNLVAVALTEIGKRMLSLPKGTFVFQSDGLGNDEIPHDPRQAALFLQLLLKYIRNFGLGGSATRLAFAKACGNLVELYVERKFVNLELYVTQPTYSTVIKVHPAQELPIDFDKTFTPFISAFLSYDEDSKRSSYIEQTSAEQETPSLQNDLPRSLTYWRGQGLRTLADYRAQQAYDIITSNEGLPKALGLLDIRDFCRDSWHRNNIAELLMYKIHKQLLQPGTSTTKILDTYVLIINTLCAELPDGTHIDPGNVLLSHTVFAIREFLRDREDAPRIVITSLLEPLPGEIHQGTRVAPASTETFSGQTSLAMFLRGDSSPAARNFEGHDLLDKNWAPAVESVRSFIDIQPKHSAFVTSQSALRHVTTLAPLNLFVEQLEKILAERLLNSDQLDFNVEMALLKILQTDFGDTHIQACENMLHDMMESSRWNEKVRCLKDEASNHLHEHGFQAKVLSHTSWQTIQWEKGTKLSGKMENLLETYQQEFERVQNDRRLDWIKELGRVTVDIELEDRTLTKEVTPFQAAVIDQFTSNASNTESQPVALTVEEIETALAADKMAVVGALNFWVSKTVLKPSPSSEDTYLVIENLSSGEEDAANQAQAAAVAMQTSEIESANMPTQADLLAQHADMYTAYVIGMLTNMGGMEAQRIHSMLTMLAPGGFAFEVEDLVALLNDMSANGRIERAGAIWRILQ